MSVFARRLQQTGNYRLKVQSFAGLKDAFYGTLSNWPASFGSTAPYVIGGRARLVCDTGYSGLQSASSYALKNSSIFVRLYAPSVGGATTDADASINILSATSGTSLAISINMVTGLIVFANYVGYSDSSSTSVPYDPVQHAWLRIRELNGQVYWETAPDTNTGPGSWTNHRTTNATTPTWVTATPNLAVSFAAHRNNGTTDYIEVDNVNIAATPSGYLAGSFDSLSDDFTAGTFAKWPQTFGTTSVTNGRGRLACTTGYSGIVSAASYTILGSASFARVYPPSSGGATTNADISMNINSTTSGTSLSTTINQFTGTITFSNQVGNYDANNIIVPYDPVQHAWLRIRELNGQVYWETAPDTNTGPGSWTNHRTTNATTPTWVSSTANQSLSFNCHRDAGTSDYAEIDNINIAQATVGGTAPSPTALYTRAAFGAYAMSGGTVNHLALESTVGAKLKRYVRYYNMGHGGASNFPQADADWCTQTGHTFVIAWDMDSTGPTFAQILAGQNDASIDAFFQSCKAHTGKIVLRMWWEMNCTGGPTKVSGGNLVTSAAEWIATWRYVYNRCKVTNGCTNVDFFFCANGTDVGTTTMEQLWPGIAYVDTAGLDTYNDQYAPWTEFNNKIAPMMNRIIALAPSIPLGLGEIGTKDIIAGQPANTNKAEWLTNMFLSTQWPNLRYIDFFSVDQTSTGGNNWRIDETTASTNVCKQYLPLAPQDPLP